MNQFPQTLSIFGAIGTDINAEQIRTALAAFDRTKPLIVEINSDGGSVQEGIAIFNQLLGWSGGVTTVVQGCACSIATIIIMAGDVRRAHESTMLMVHAPWSSTTGNAEELRGTAALLDQVASTMALAYRRTGQSDGVIQSWLDGKDHWFTAGDAKQLGFFTDIETSGLQARAPANILASRHQIPHQLKASIMPQSIQKISDSDAQAIRSAAVQSENIRRNDIRSSFSRFSQCDGVPALLAACESDPSVSPQAACDRLLAHIGSQSSSVMGAHRFIEVGAIQNGTDDRISDFVTAATDVLAMRGGMKVSAPHPAAQDLKRMSISGMAEKLLSMQGRLPVDRSPSSLIRASLVTSDFPLLLSNTANKFLRDGYETSNNGFSQFTAEREVPDFKAGSLVNLSEAPSLEFIAEGGQYHHGYFTESASTFQIKTQGKIIVLTRQALVNDDLSSFTSIPRAFGIAARRAEADAVYARLTENAALSDGIPLFHASHKNLGSTVGLSVDRLAEARAAMRKHKGIGGLGYLDVQPRYLIVPVALETAAEQLLASLVDPSKNNDTGNAAFVRGLTLVADPRLDDSSTTAWYMAADPMQIEGILRAYLSGEPRPFLEENIEFRTDSISYKVRLDFAAGVVDHRALYKNPGA